MNQRTAQLLVRSLTIGVTAVLGVGIVISSWAGNPVTWTSMLNMLLVALPLAGIYAMSASGLVVVYTTTGIFNFAQGAIGMFFAYVYWQFRDPTNGFGWPTWIAFPLVILVLAPLFGVALDRIIMRHLGGQTLVTQLMVTVGLMFALIGLAGMIWNQNEGHTLTPLFPGEGVHIGDVVLTYHRVITIVAALLIAIGLRLLLFRTRSGIAMRAVVDNRNLASLSGARSAWLSSFSWALGCSLGALAGVLLAPEVDMATGGALTLLIITAFAAAVVGRLRSLPLTYLGALILGLVTSFSSNFLSFSGRWTGLQGAFPVVMLFVVLLLLPRADLRFARTHVIKRVERVTTVRDTMLGMGALVIIMIVVSSFLSETNLSRFSLGMCTALVALSLVPLTGWAGQVSLAPLAFAGIGATMYARLGGDHGSLLAVVLAGLICMPIGALLAFPAMRLQGLYLALVTLAFAALVDAVWYAQSFAVGTGTLNVEHLKLFGWQATSERSFLVLVTVVFAIFSVLVVALRRSAFGRRLVALRDSEAASATVGVNILETKLVVFALSAGMSGFAGAFMVQHYKTLSASATTNGFAMLAGLPIVLALVIGGVACVSGALFAGMFGLFTLLIQDNWHLSLWQDVTYLAPGLAALGIIRNPSGAVVEIGAGFAPLLPWRRDAREDQAELKAAIYEPEVGELGLTREFEEADVLLLDRGLGVSNDIPRLATTRGASP